MDREEQVAEFGVAKDGRPVVGQNDAVTPVGGAPLPAKFIGAAFNDGQTVDGAG